MHILLATSNPHKLQEIRDVFAGCGREATLEGERPESVELRSLMDLNLSIPEPHEDQPTFDGNAILKARHYAKTAGLMCLAEDSGLEVDALGGAPGVHSARYAGVREGGRATIDPANNLRLLRELGDLPRERRTARFICTMALVAPPQAARGLAHTDYRAKPSDILILVRGSVEGRILGPGDKGYALDNPRGRGTNGFGYDPLFLIPELNRTTAELTATEKNAISHRGRAARMIWRQLRQISL